jgi:beta-phosphoglucomutase
VVRSPPAAEAARAAGQKRFGCGYDAGHMLRAILFDFNGVLVNDEPLHLELLARVLAEEGLPDRPDPFWRRYIGRPDRDVFAEELAAFGETPTEARLLRLGARKASYYQERIRRDGYPFFPGAVDLVQEAAAAGFTLGVVSGALRAEVEGALRQAGLRAAFKVLVTAEDTKRGKPDPAGYRLALERLNSQPPLPARLFHPHEVLAIEDSPAGIAAAREAELVTLAVAQSHHPAELVGADDVRDGLEGLTLAELQRLYAVSSRS